jgi:hypothetical protein
MDEKKPEVKEEVKLEDLLKQIEDLKADSAAKAAEIESLKKANTNASADASEWKKKFRATQDEATRKAAEEAEAKQAMLDELNALKAEKRISTYQAKLMEVGYDAQTAASMAMSLPEGISEDFFATQKAFLETQKQIAKTEALNNQPSLTPGLPPAAPNKEDAEWREWMGLPKK